MNDSTVPSRPNQPSATLGRAALVLLMLAPLGGCSKWFGGGANELTYEGIRFIGDSKAIKDDKRSFVAYAEPASASLEGARQAAYYEGVQYCIGYLGTSDIDWQVGPDTPADQLIVTNNRLTFRGTCKE